MPASGDTLNDLVWFYENAESMPLFDGNGQNYRDSQGYAILPFPDRMPPVPMPMRTVGEFHELMEPV